MIFKPWRNREKKEKAEKQKRTCKKCLRYDICGDPFRTGDCYLKVTKKDLKEMKRNMAGK